VDSIALRAHRARCPQCLGAALVLEGDAHGEAFRMLRCPTCGDAVVEMSRCPLCEGTAQRSTMARSLFAVYVCESGCLPFAFDSMAEEALRRNDYDAARAALRKRVRGSDQKGALHPLLVTGRIVDDVRQNLEDEAEAGG
jgi:hypothetical protein